MGITLQEVEQADPELGSINFTGGFPVGMDFAPSIIFCILYVLSLPLFVYRVARPQDRTWLLARPGIFVILRLVSLIIRIVMSRGNITEGLLIAELILVSIGYMFLIDPILKLWTRHVQTHVARNQRPVWLVKLERVLQLALMAAIATAIAGGVEVSSALRDPSQIGTVNSLRHASYILSFCVVAVVTLAHTLTHFRFHLDGRLTAYLYIPMVALLIVGIYRVVQTFSGPGSGIRTQAAFYVMNITFEFIAYMFYLICPMAQWYPGATGNQGPNQVPPVTTYDEEAAANKETNGNPDAPRHHTRY